MLGFARAVLIPLLDGKVSPRERVSIAELFVRARVENREQAVAEPVASNDPWLKSCGAYAIGTFTIKSLEVKLGPRLEDPDPALARNGPRHETSSGGARRELLSVRGLVQSPHESGAAARAHRKADAYAPRRGPGA